MPIFHIFILSILIFGHFHGTSAPKQTQMKLKKIQERALRLVYDDYYISYMELLTKANLLTLETRRMRTKALETFKISNGLVSRLLSNLFIKREGKCNF